MSTFSNQMPAPHSAAVLPTEALTFQQPDGLGVDVLDGAFRFFRLR